jgi:hypothetical protein
MLSASDGLYSSLGLSDTGGAIKRANSRS